MSTIVFFLYVFKENRDKFISVIRFSIILWLLLSFIEYLFPEFHDLLFSRDNSGIDSSRGMRIFAPEPTIAAIFILSIQISFSSILSKVERSILLLLALSTLNPISIISLIVHFKTRLFQLALMSSVLLFTLFPEISNKRLAIVSSSMIEKGIVRTVYSDRSMNTRANGMRELSLMIQRLDFFGYDYSEEYVGFGKSRTNIQATSGIFASLHELGLLLLMISFLVLIKVRSFWQALLFVLFLFVGSPGHMLPIFSIITKYE